jgi:hypothetical protein
MRVTLTALIVIVGCTAIGGAAPRGADNTLPKLKVEKAPSEAAVVRPLVPLGQLVEETPDGSQVLGLYQGARTIIDVEEANASIKAQVAKAQTIVSGLARLHAANVNTCENADAAQIDAIGHKAKALSAMLVRVDGELTKSLSAMRHKVEAERPGSIRAREDVNRLELATYELGRLRVQAQEVAKGVERLAVSIRRMSGSCAPTPIPALFAERPAPVSAALPARRPQAFSTRRSIKPASAPGPRFGW